MTRAARLLAVAVLVFVPATALAGGRGPFSQVAVGGGAVWATDGTTAMRLDASTGKRASAALALACCDYLYPDATVIADGGLWSIGGGLLTHRDAADGRLAAPPLRVGSPPSSLVADTGRIWVIDMLGRRVSQISTSSGRSAGGSLILGPRLWAGRTALGSLWVTQLGYRTPRQRREGGAGRRGHLIRVSLATGRVQARIRVGRDPMDVAESGGRIWVANATDGTLSEVDPGTDRVVRVVRIGGSPLALAATGSRIVVGLGARIVWVDSTTGRVVGSQRVGGRVIDLEAAAGAIWVGREGAGQPLRALSGARRNK